jgi:hypothetical protein
VITTNTSSEGFSKRAAQATFEEGAIPITLLDGVKLLALLIEH